MCLMLKLFRIFNILSAKWWIALWSCGHISSMFGQDNKRCGPVEQIFNILSAKWTIANKNSSINIKLTIWQLKLMSRV